VFLAAPLSQPGVGPLCSHLSLSVFVKWDVLYRDISLNMLLDMSVLCRAYAVDRVDMERLDDK